MHSSAIIENQRIKQRPNTACSRRRRSDNERAAADAARWADKKEIDLDATSATLIAALVAALASTLGLALRIRADSRAELRRAYRGRLEPILEEIGDALHKIVACSVLAVRDKGTENRRYFDSKKHEAREVLRRLRPRVRYQLWGLDDGFKTLIALPDWVDARGVKDHEQLLTHASALRLAIDQAIQNSYRNGEPPSTLARIRVRICARRMWSAWGGLQEELDRESVPVRRETVIHPKTRATIVRRDGEILTARSTDGTEYRVSAANRTGKGSRSLAQPGTEVNLYKRDGEDFWRYRFAGKPASGVAAQQSVAPDGRNVQGPARR